MAAGRTGRQVQFSPFSSSSPSDRSIPLWTLMSRHGTAHDFTVLLQESPQPSYPSKTLKAPQESNSQGAVTKKAESHRASVQIHWHSHSLCSHRTAALSTYTRPHGSKNWALRQGGWALSWQDAQVRPVAAVQGAQGTAGRVTMTLRLLIYSVCHGGHNQGDILRLISQCPLLNGAISPQAQGPGVLAVCPGVGVVGPRRQPPLPRGQSHW